jgi:hypothetical protein
MQMLKVEAKRNFYALPQPRIKVRFMHEPSWPPVNAGRYLVLFPGGSGAASAAIDKLESACAHAHLG